MATFIIVLKFGIFTRLVVVKACEHSYELALHVSVGSVIFCVYTDLVKFCSGVSGWNSNAFFDRKDTFVPLQLSVKSGPVLKHKRKENKESVIFE